MNDKIELFERHLQSEEKSENTILKYIRDVKEFYLWESGNTETTKETLVNYKNHLRKQGLKVSTINSKISSLNTYFSYTAQKNLKIKLIKYQKSLFGDNNKKLTRQEFFRLHQAAESNYRLKLLIETIAATGIRVSELKFITAESLDTCKALVDNKGKIRTILIPRKLCKKLKDYCRNQNIKNGPIFLTRNSTPISRKHIWQMLKNLSIKANVPKEKVFPHNLRHLFAHEFYKQTHDIVKLAAILGHSSIETTRIYTKQTEDECRIEIEKIHFLRE